MRQRLQVERFESRTFLSGGLDSSFGTDGIISGYSNVLPGGAVQAMALLPDGDIIVAGPGSTDSSATSPAFEVVRLTPNGSADATFGAGGAASLGTFPFNSIAAIALQQDGKILVAGTSGTSPTEDVIIARLNADGSIDSSFGDAGVVTSAFGVGQTSTADPIVVQPDGKIIVAALTANDGLGVERFTSTGTMDTSFATQGQFTTTQSLVEVTSLALTATGSILVGGDGGAIFVTRLTSEGTLDSTFGESGTATLNVNGGRLVQIGLQSNGKIILAGTTGSSGVVLASDTMLAARLTQSGELDKSFGTRGITKVTFPDRGEADHKFAKANSNGFAAAMAIGDDDKIVLAGSVQVLISLDDGPGPSDFATVRLLSTGKIDRSFGTAGKVTTGNGNIWPGDYNAADAVAIQPDGSIVVAGSGGDGGSGAAVQYRADGTLDRQFGYNGRVGPFPLSPPADASAVQADEKIVVASSSGLARLLTNGQLDPTFGDRGLSLQKNDDIDDLGLNRVSRVVGLLIEPDGKILVATSIDNLAQTNGYQITLTRYNSNGAIDRKFGRNGTAAVDAGRGVKDANFESFTLQSNGKILVLSDTAVSRLLPNGSPDLAFGTRGVVPALVTANFTQMVVGQDTISIFGASSVPALKLSDPGSSELLMMELDGRGKTIVPVQSFAINTPYATISAFAQDDGSEWVFIKETPGVSVYRFEGSEIDSGFNNNQGVISPPTLANFTSVGNVLFNNGVYYIVGYSGDSGPAEIVAINVAINGIGSIDTGFGTDGVLTLPSSVASGPASGNTLLGGNGVIYAIGLNSFAAIAV